MAVTAMLYWPAMGVGQVTTPALLMVMPLGAPAKVKVTGLDALVDTVNDKAVPTVPVTAVDGTVGAALAFVPVRLFSKLLALGVPKPASSS